MLRARPEQQHHFTDPSEWKHGRTVTVALLGSLALFVICSLAAGYLNASVPISWGVVEEVGTSWQKPLDSRMTSSARYAIVSVTPAGAAVGLQPGDLVDMTRWTLRERLAFAYPTFLHASKVTYQRGQQSLVSRESPGTLNADIDRSRISDVTLRLLLLCSGLLIIQYGHGLAALAAGVYLTMISMADSPAMTFAGLPAWVQTSGLVLATLGRLGAYSARFAFVMQLLSQPSRRIGLAMWFVFGTLLLILFVLDVSHVGGLLIGTAPIPFRTSILPAIQILVQIGHL